jgi:hypothetical protein
MVFQREVRRLDQNLLVFPAFFSKKFHLDSHGANTLMSGRDCRMGRGGEWLRFD